MTTNSNIISVTKNITAMKPEITESGDILLRSKALTPLGSSNVGATHNVTKTPTKVISGGSSSDYTAPCAG